MSNRKQKVEELLADLHSLRRCMSFKSAHSGSLPRVTPSQWGVLMHIEHQGKSTVKEVAQALVISSSAATQLVDGLVKSGYLLRETPPHDRRTTVLTLSKKTKAQVDRMKQQTIQTFLAAFKALSDQEFEQFCQLHQKIARHIGGPKFKKKIIPHH